MSYFRDQLPETGRPFNVLLLGLSIPGSYDRGRQKYVLREGTFYADGENYPYLYQLEPIPRMLASDLRKKEETLDLIIMLETDKAGEKRMVVFPDKTEKLLSADQYMRKTLPAYIKPAPRFKTIPINEYAPAEGIDETVRCLRSLKNETPDLRLYLDEHGGFRETSLVLEAMVSLLRNEINVQEVYTVHYTEGKAEIVIDPALKIFDFVSGINEFTYYGRIESLKRYYEKNPDPSVQDLMACITDVASGIQLSNILKFESGLDALGRYFSRERPLDSEKTPTDSPCQYLALFEEAIKNDYASLLTPERTTADEIAWCLKKGFYQQCLTLLEFRMPTDLLDLGVYSYDRSRLSVPADRQPDFHSQDVFVFYHVFPDGLRRALRLDSPPEFNEWLLTFLKNQKFESIWANEELREESSYFPSKLTCGDFRTESFPVTVSAEARPRVFAFLLLHVALRQTRVSTANLSVNHIVGALQFYLKWYGELSKVLANERKDFFREK
ncbi:MAG: hypothetical protein K6E30_07245 [Lachnospiraceae bacterium]|nr:hypothetical protein [Lachnospiraceae bacterium]